LLSSRLPRGLACCGSHSETGGRNTEFQTDPLPEKGLLDCPAFRIRGTSPARLKSVLIDVTYGDSLGAAQQMSRDEPRPVSSPNRATILP
jgi:hypothetical protein